ncbi:MAG: hypothetical protein AB8G77_21275 [Rhodothermales bacterium]
MTQISHGNGCCIRVCGQLAGKRAFDGIFVQIKALFEFDAAHRAQKGTQIWAKRAHNAPRK